MTDCAASRKAFEVAYRDLLMADAAKMRCDDRVSEDEKRRAFDRYIRENPGATSLDLIERFNLSATKTKVVLKKMHDEGKLRRSRRHKNDPFRYEVTT